VHEVHAYARPSWAHGRHAQCAGQPCNSPFVILNKVRRFVAPQCTIANVISLQPGSTCATAQQHVLPTVLPSSTTFFFSSTQLSTNSFTLSALLFNTYGVQYPAPGRQELENLNSVQWPALCFLRVRRQKCILLLIACEHIVIWHMIVSHCGSITQETETDSGLDLITLLCRVKSAVCCTFGA
jgi:hypothetical protein